MSGHLDQVVACRFTIQEWATISAHLLAPPASDEQAKSLAASIRAQVLSAPED